MVTIFTSDGNLSRLLQGLAVEIARNRDRLGTKRRFELIGGHPALDLVNTLDWRFRDTGPEELINNYAEVVSFIEQSGMIGSNDARRLLRGVPGNKAEKIVAAVRELREALAEILYAAIAGKSPSASSVRKLEAWLNEATAQQQLRWEGAKLEWKLPQSPSPATPFWLLALSAGPSGHIKTRCRCCASAAMTSAGGSFSIPARITRGAGAI